MGTIGPGSRVPLYGAPVAALDFETTWEAGGERPGVRGGRYQEQVQHPVSVAVVHARLGVEGEEVAFSTLIDPGVKIRREATEIHGISDRDVRGAPAFEAVADDLLAALDGRVLLAFNLPFDWSVLVEALERAGRTDDAPPFYGFDPLVWARVVFKYEKGKRLGDVARRYGVVLDAHDAASDARAAIRVAPKLIRDLVRDGHVEGSDVATVGSFWRSTVRSAREWEDGLRDYYLEHGKPEPARYWRAILGVST